MKFMKFPRIAAFFLVASQLFATYGEGNPRLEKLYSTFMSPCCWEQNLTEHDSAIAEELRARILAMVNEGRSDQEIKTILVKQYGKRILALPEGMERSWLFGTPWLVSAAGLFVMLVLMRRMRTINPALGAPTMKPAKLAGWDDE